MRYIISRLISSMVLVLCITTSRPHAQTITLVKDVYSSTYDLGLLCPRQVWWTLKASDIADVKRDPSWRFVDDIDHPLGLATHADFAKSGYHRGHMCPAKDRSFSIDAMRHTFTTSNIAPQVPAVNTGVWLQTERWCRAAAIMYDSVCVLAMPVFIDRDTVRIGRHRLAVPHAFFKACWLPKNDSVINAWFIFNSDYEKEYTKGNKKQ